MATKYDVFLSFRGEDTRYNFVSHLTKDLQNKKIQAFIDDDLIRGDEISPALMRAIEVSTISIIIFSENYADSKWCLDELQKIFECRDALKQIVIPVFYKVDPTNVRNQSGEFGTAFNRLLDKIPLSKLHPKEQIWRNALKSAANISGFHSFNIGSEANLIDDIIVDVLKKLKTASSNACDDKGLVGINSRKEKIMRLLGTESLEFRMVGIWGMGGVGKTTIAEAVFNQISSEFERYYFVGNVRKKAKKDGLSSMRNNLISKLLKDDNLEIHTPRIGDGSIKERLRKAKVLVVLDDVDDSLQLEKLIGERGTNQFSEGSIVIVTTRDKHVLNAHDITCVYDMDMLDDRDALELFTYHALGPGQPMEPYLEISKKIVEYAQGVPLALKILGSSLHGKTHIEDWKGELKKLKKLPNMKILGVLKTSYDSLSDEEKEIFLDIVCFFKDENIDKVRNVLDGFHVSLHSGIKVLIDKSLINIISHKKRSIWDRNENVSIDVVEMHDLIEEMGCNIVIEESEEVGSRSRIWRAEDVRDVLTQNTGTNKIKSILLDVNVQRVNQMKLNPQAFANIYHLKFLKINSIFFPKILFSTGLVSLPEGLRYLHWNDYPLEYLPPKFNPTNLVELHLSRSRLERLWGGTQNLCNLKVLNLEYSINLVTIPDLSFATNLEELNLRGCSTLDTIPFSIQNCTSLKHLDLSNTGLTEIPSYIQYLKSLTYLCLSCCDIMDIPSSIKYLTSLKHLNLHGCKSLTEIPSSIQYVKNLTYLDLSGCDLTRIPSFIEHLTRLEHLNLSHSSGMTEDISSVPHISTQITNYPNLPRSIKFLEVDGIFIEVYPSSIQLLTGLVELVLWNCSGYQMSSVRLRELNFQIPQSCKIQMNGITMCESDPSMEE